MSTESRNLRGLRSQKRLSRRELKAYAQLMGIKPRWYWFTFYIRRRIYREIRLLRIEVRSTK